MVDIAGAEDHDLYHGLNLGSRIVKRCCPLLICLVASLLFTLIGCQGLAGGPREPDPVAVTTGEPTIAEPTEPNKPAPEITFLDMTQIDELLAGLSPTPQMRAMAAALIYAGLRRGELLHLTRKDVDLGHRLIHVRAQTIDGARWQPKTGRNRSVPVSDRLLAELTRWAGPGSPTWYFPSPEGKFWDADNFSKAIRRAQEPLDTSWKCLDFRHTFGTQLARRGVSLYKISTLMGNSPGICRRHYAFLLSEDLKEEVEFGHVEPIIVGEAGARREDSSGSRRREGNSAQTPATV